MTDRAVTADREQLFATLADPATTGQFFERVSDSVSWTVEGTHPLAGTYTSKRAFFDSTFTILSPLMRDGLRLEVRNLHVADDYTIAELQGPRSVLASRLRRLPSPGGQARPRVTLCANRLRGFLGFDCSGLTFVIRTATAVPSRRRCFLSHHYALPCTRFRDWRHRSRGVCE